MDPRVARARREEVELLKGTQTFPTENASNHRGSKRSFRQGKSDLPRNAGQCKLLHFGHHRRQPTQSSNTASNRHPIERSTSWSTFLKERQSQRVSPTSSPCTTLFTTFFCYSDDRSCWQKGTCRVASDSGVSRPKATLYGTPAVGLTAPDVVESSNLSTAPLALARWVRESTTKIAGPIYPLVMSGHSSNFRNRTQSQEESGEQTIFGCG